MAITGSVTCALCQRPPAGYATVTENGVTLRLCHDDSELSPGGTRMTCYHRWTVYHERPKPDGSGTFYADSEGFLAMLDAVDEAIDD